MKMVNRTENQDETMGGLTSRMIPMNNNNNVFVVGCILPPKKSPAMGRMFGCPLGLS